MAELTQEHLKELLIYDPDTGVFTNKVQRHIRGKVGEPTGKPNKLGYVFISIEGKVYHAARLAFLYMRGRWPLEIDHINGRRWDNRWVNIRETTHSQNCFCREPRKAA